jgi:CRP/FNR family cyclic AMP-dependent transcriptional regulator
MNDNLPLLENIVLFQDFKKDKKVLRKIESLFVERKARRGDRIIKEGEVGDELYIIKKGQVRVEKNTLQNEPYTVVTLTADQHVFFGEIGLLLNDTRSATVVAEVDCVFLVTNRSKFTEFGENEPFVALMITRQIAQILAKRLHKTNQDVVTLFSALVSEIEGESSWE